MPKLTGRPNFAAIRDHLFDRIHLSGEQMKNDFPNTLRTAIKTEIWKQFVTFEGKPFANLVEWLQYQFPNGVSMGRGQHVITYEDALKLTEVAPDVHQVLLESASKGKPGPKNGNGLKPSTVLIQRSKSHSRIVLSVRLAQEKPKYYEAYMRGEYKSVTAAAIAAGLLKDNGNLRRAKSAFRKMTPEQRKEFLQWVRRENNG